MMNPALSFGRAEHEPTAFKLLLMLRWQLLNVMLQQMLLKRLVLGSNRPHRCDPRRRELCSWSRRLLRLWLRHMVNNPVLMQSQAHQRLAGHHPSLVLTGSFRQKVPSQRPRCAGFRRGSSASCIWIKRMRSSACSRTSTSKRIAPGSAGWMALLVRLINTLGTIWKRSKRESPTPMNARRNASGTCAAAQSEFLRDCWRDTRHFESSSKWREATSPRPSECSGPESEAIWSKEGNLFTVVARKLIWRTTVRIGNKSHSWIRLVLFILGSPG